MNEPFAVVLDLYDRGLFLDAWEAGKSLGPMDLWPATEPRILAGRLALQLGAPRLSRFLRITTYRGHREDRQAQYYYVWTVAERRGPYAAWRERQRLGAPQESENDVDRADYHGQCAQLLGGLRDFDAAEEHLTLAAAAMPPRPWFFVERSGLREFEDRYDEALEAAQTALAMNATYPPAVYATAHCLKLLERGEEALELVQEKSRVIQSGYLVSQLIGFLISLRRLDEAEEQLERFRQLTPIGEKSTRQWVTAIRANIAGHRGDYQRALEYAGELDDPFHQKTAERISDFLLDQPDRPPRKGELTVPFVRQHYMTCAPATLAAISRFWKRPAEHLSVAEEICYDGTPAHSERKWAEEHGWTAKEFRTDWETTSALIDRGVPFTLTIADATSGHMQAVIGYDEATGVIKTRDPLHHETEEFYAPAFFEAQRSVGPRGMAMVPADHADLLDDIALPDTDIYDLFHELHVALDCHDRDRARSFYRRMTEVAAGHRLTLTARRAIAGYDANPHEALAAIDDLLELYPDDEGLLLARLYSMRQLSTRQDRLSWLADLCGRESIRPVFLIEYATELSDDDREMDRAVWLCRRALRLRPLDPRAMHQLAVMNWRQGRHGEALELFRFAACGAEHQEGLAQSYFTAARWVKRTDSALRFLRNRSARLSRHSSQPVMTLCHALDQLDRTDEAFDVLTEALELRPDDGDLHLFTASKHAQFGEAQRARVHLDRAKGRVKYTAWLAEAAMEARLAGDSAAALSTWREVLESEPLDMKAHGMIARLLSETSGNAEAVAHLSAYCDRFPHHAELHLLRYHWTEGEPAVRREPVLRDLLDIDPTNAWVHGQLALNLARQGRFDEALTAANDATGLETQNASSHATKGHVLARLGRMDEAADSFRSAIRLAADTEDAIRGLLESCGKTLLDRKEALRFVEEESLRQAMLDGGVLAFRDVARGILTPAELLSTLQRVHRERPDAWHSWSALSQHLSEMGRTDEALEVARGATELFSRLARVWLDLSRVHRQRFEDVEQIAALERARELNPDWTEAIFDMCEALERLGRFDESRQVLDRAITRTPMDPTLRGRLALLLYNRREADKAVEVLREAVRVNPDYSWGWNSLIEWCAERGEVAAVMAMADDLARARATEPHAWVRLAEIQLAVNDYESALASIDRAIEIDPTHVPAYDQKAVAHVSARQFAEAARACEPSALEQRQPVPLLARAAWVDAMRGDLSQAIERMRSVLAESSDHRWGWQCLMTWYAEKGEFKEAMEAAERLAWLDPTDVEPLGWLAEMKTKLRDLKGAKDVYRRAHQAQPNYLFAGFEYFALQLQDRELEDAERTLDVLSLHAPEENLLAARIHLAVAQRQQAEAIELLPRLCTNPDSDPQPIVSSVGCLLDARCEVHVEYALQMVLKGPTWHDVVPALWMESVLKLDSYGGLRDYRWLRGMGDRGKPAVITLLAGLATKPSPPSLFADLLVRWHFWLVRRAFRTWKESDNEFWGQVAFVFLKHNRLRAAARWMADWSERDGLEEWMLHNAAIAYLNLSRDDDALRVLRLVGRDPTLRGQAKAEMLLWCALGACLDDDLPLAAALLHETPSDAVPKSSRRFREFAEWLRQVLSDPKEGSPSTTVRKSLLRLGQAEAPADVAAKRLFRLAQHKAAAHAGQRWRSFTTWLDLKQPVVTWVIFVLLIVMVFGVLS